MGVPSKNLLNKWKTFLDLVGTSMLISRIVPLFCIPVNLCFLVTPWCYMSEVYTSRAARSRSRSIRRMIPQDDDREADDDILLLQFMDQRLTSFLWIRTDDSLEEAIPVTDVRTPLNLCDAL